MENDFWREVYENAPSEACKRFFRLGFSQSLTGKTDDGKHKVQRESIYSELDIDDWKYLKKVHPSTPFTKICSEKIAELSFKR